MFTIKTVCRPFASLFFMYYDQLIAVPTGVKVFKWVSDHGGRGAMTFEYADAILTGISSCCHQWWLLRHYGCAITPVD